MSETLKHEHELRSDSQSSRSSICVLRRQSSRNTIHSDSDITSDTNCKIVLDLSHIASEHLNQRKKRIKYDPKSQTYKHRHSEQQLLAPSSSASHSAVISRSVLPHSVSTSVHQSAFSAHSVSQSEDTLSASECFYLFDSNSNNNNRTASIDDIEKLKKPHPNQNSTNAKVKYELYSDEDHEEMAEEELNKPSYRYCIKLPPITIPMSKKAYIKQVGPTLLHLDMIDDDGSIKRQVIQQLKEKRLKREKRRKQKVKTEKCFVDKHKKHRKRLHDEREDEEESSLNIMQRISNMAKSFIFENNRDFNLKILDVDYFQCKVDAYI